MRLLHNNHNIMINCAEHFLRQLKSMWNIDVTPRLYHTFMHIINFMFSALSCCNHADISEIILYQWNNLIVSKERKHSMSCKAETRFAQNKHSLVYELWVVLDTNFSDFIYEISISDLATNNYDRAKNVLSFHAAVTSYDQ